LQTLGRRELVPVLHLSEDLLAAVYDVADIVSPPFPAQSCDSGDGFLELQELLALKLQAVAIFENALRAVDPRELAGRRPDLTDDLTKLVPQLGRRAFCDVLDALKELGPLGSSGV